MDDWRFGPATDAMEAATTVLRERDDDRGAGRRAGPPAAVRHRDPLPGRRHAERARDARRSASGERRRPGPPRGGVRRRRGAAGLADDGLGLDGKDPAATLEAARTAWEDGDPATATADADATLAMLAAAPEAGRSRATTIGGAVGAVLVVLLVLAILLVARRRRPRRTPVIVAGASPQAAGCRPVIRAASAPAADRRGRGRTLHSRPTAPRAAQRRPRRPVTKERPDVDRTRSKRSPGPADGPAAHPPVARDPVRRDRRRVLRARQQHPGPRGHRPLRDDGAVLPSRGRAVRHRRGLEPPRARARGRARRDRRGARGRGPRLREGGRPPDPGPLPRIRPVRDRDPRHARAVDRLGDGRPRVRRCRGAPPGHLVRGPPRAPRHHRRPGLRGDRRGLRRRVDARRGAAGRAQPDGHDAPLPGADLRRHRRGRGGVRPPHARRRAADRPRRHLQGRGGGGPPGRACPRRPALRDPPRHAVRARPRHRLPRDRGPGAPRPGGVRARDDHRVGRADAGPDPLLPRPGRGGRLVRRRLVHLRRDADRLHRRHQGDRRLADRQARPDPGPDREPEAPAARSGIVARGLATAR